MEPDPKIKNLKCFQRQFMNELFLMKSSKNFLSGIIPGGTLAHGQSALKIHQRGYICRLTDALGEIYEGVWSVLKDREFFQMAEAYILTNPSTSYNLSDYGRHFPDFLNSSKAVGAYPFITELARLDLAFYDVFHSPQHDSIEPNALVVLEEFPYTILTFGSSIKLLKLSFRIYETWKTRAQKIVDINEFPGDQYLVLYKQNSQIFVKELEKQSFRLLSALVLGMSLGEYLDNNEVSQDDMASLFYFIASARLVSSFIKI